MQDGPGWIGRLEAGLKKGKVLPVVAAAIVLPLVRQLQQPEQSAMADQHRTIANFSGPPPRAR